MKVRGMIVAVCVTALVGSVCLQMGNSAFSQQKTLDVAIHDAPWRAGYHAVVEVFEQKSGVKIKTHIFPFAELYMKEIAEVTRGGSAFDVMEFPSPSLPFFYEGRYLWPLKQIDPQFEYDPQLLTYGNAAWWSFEKHYTDPDGVLYSIPFMGNFHLFWYRGDKYEEAGLAAPPETWDEVVTAAEKLHNPNEGFYGYVIRGKRGNPVFFNYYLLMLSWGADMWADPPDDWTVTVNSERAKEALRFYLGLRKWSPPGPGDIGQGDLIAILSTGRAAQAHVVAAAYSHFDNPKESVVPYKLEPVVVPKSPYGIRKPVAGIQTWGIPKSSKDPELALEFIKFFTSYEGQLIWTKNGGVPTRKDILASELAKQKEYRYLKAMSESVPYHTGWDWTTVHFQMQDVLGRHLNAAVVGLETAEEALDAAAVELVEIMKKAKM